MVRKDIARMATLLREREIAEAEALEAAEPRSKHERASDRDQTTARPRRPQGARGRWSPPRRWTRRSSSRSSTACATRRYGKTVQRTKHLYVHDETNDAGVGDRVRIMETRPLSKLKRWRLVEVLERAR